MQQQASATADRDSVAPQSRIRELSAITVESTDPEKWERFGGTVLGMAVERSGDTVQLKMDGYPHRFLITKGPKDRLSALTWLARDAESVAEIKNRWESAGGKAVPARRSESWSGKTPDYCFEDHLGTVHEVFGTPPEESPFEPVPQVSGFVTGTHGLGHIVFYDNVDRADVLYLDVFGMDLRIDAKKTQVGGRGHFYGCNPRDHTVAAVEVDGQADGVMHVMVEMLDIDDVGGALDRAVSNGFPPRTALGRHLDHVISFYVPTPGGFDMEVGCGGRVVGDPASEAKKVRSWGHAGIRS